MIFLRVVDIFCCNNDFWPIYTMNMTSRFLVNSINLCFCCMFFVEQSINLCMEMCSNSINLPVSCHPGRGILNKNLIFWMLLIFVWCSDSYDSPARKGKQSSKKCLIVLCWIGWIRILFETNQFKRMFLFHVFFEDLKSWIINLSSVAIKKNKVSLVMYYVCAIRALKMYKSV